MITSTGPDRIERQGGETPRVEFGNAAIADRLDEVALLLEEQHADAFRVRAYRRAATTLRWTERSVADILASEGLEGLERLPGIGERIGRSIRALLLTGRLPLLERLRGESDPEGLLRSLPGIGPKTAQLLHEELGIDSLTELEMAAYDGRLRDLAGMGEKRLAGIRDTLATRLGRTRLPRPSLTAEPPVAELLAVDRHYRDAARAGRLRRIAPRRFNPSGAAWLPILHTRRGAHDYTALFSNTARAHQLGRTRDWVVLYCESGGSERQYTVITATRGELAGRRIVRGREAECARHYRANQGRSAPVGG